MKIRITLWTDLFTTECREFLDECMQNNPIQSEYYIRLLVSGRTPFTLGELADQVRSVYGRYNQSIYFTQEEGGHYDKYFNSGTRTGRKGERLLNSFFFHGNPLDEGEVPPEVLHYLENYRHRHKQLIKYLVNN